MKKATLILIALLALVTTAQAQKYHDALGCEAFGHVKSITANAGGMSNVTRFTEDGRMQQDGLSDQVYDADGYITSFSQEVQGMKGTVTLTYNADHRVAQQVMSIMGGTITQKFTYDNRGQVVSEETTMAGQGMSQSITTTYTYKTFDSHGNWTSRTASMGGQTMELSRTIEYY